MKIIFKVCFLLRSGTQENEKLKREHIREKNFSSGTKEILIFSVAQKWFSQNILFPFVEVLHKVLDNCADRLRNSSQIQKQVK
jgi:hypothetical protein